MWGCPTKELPYLEGAWSARKCAKPAGVHESSCEADVRICAMLCEGLYQGLIRARKGTKLARLKTLQRMHTNVQRLRGLDQRQSVHGNGQSLQGLR